MTFKDLERRIRSNPILEQQSKPLFQRLRHRRFWYFDQEQHRQASMMLYHDCCFNHIIGLPRKEGIEKPIFDYQKLLYDNLMIPAAVLNHRKNSFKDKHLWVKKATGLGITEFFLRLMVWLATTDDIYRNSQFCIVTGPNQDIAIKLIKRMKTMFEPHGITFANKETVLELNGVTIEAFPSNHLDAYRALENPKFIFIDEGDFFIKSEQEDVRHVSERYIGKSDPYIVMVSTPNAPGGLFERIEKESEETCIYNRLKLDYTYGLNKIYTIGEIEKAKQSPSFEREYNLKYLGLIGNVFSVRDIDAAIEKGNRLKVLSDSDNAYSQKSMGIDPGFGSSAFAIVITEWIDSQINVVYAEEWEKADFNEMINKTLGLIQKYGISKSNSCQIFVDGSNPSFIRSLKHQLGEREDYEEEIKYYKSNFKNYNWTSEMLIIPVSFAKKHKEMLAHTKKLMENDGGQIAINPKFDKLITSLRTAVANESTLDKSQTSFNDLLDALRMSLSFYH